MMYILPESLSEIAQHVWRNAGVELVIFGVTLAISLLLRRPVEILSFIRKGAKEQCRDKLGSTKSASCRQDRHDIPSPRKSAAAAQAAPYAAARHEKKAAASQNKADSSKVVDDIFNIMQVRPGVSSATQALQMYAELRPCLGLSKQGSDSLAASPLVDVLRRSRHSPLDLYSLLVQCAVRSQQCHLVERLIEDMISLSVVRSCSFYESAMKQLAAQKQYRLALWVYERLQADGLEPSAVTCSCLVSFANEVGEYKLAVSFFEKLSSMTTPSIRAFMTILRVHAQQQNWKASLSVFKSMLEKGVKADSLCMNIVLATGVATENLQDAYELLSKCPEFSDVVSYNTLIKGFARRGDVKAASRICESMKQRGLKPNSITFNTLIDAAVRSNTPGRAWEILAEMRSLGLTADKFTCSIIVRGMAKGLEPETTQLKAALELLRESGSVCDAALRSALYHALLEAAQQAQDAALVKQIAAGMKSQGIVPSDVSARKALQMELAT